MIVGGILFEIPPSLVSHAVVSILWLTWPLVR